MATFPELKTGAIAQYPLTKEVRFRNQALRFVDGSEQRYRNSAGPLHRWEIALDQLDEGELAQLERFFVELQGSFGTFVFTDPASGQEYAKCSLRAGSFEAIAAGELNHMAWLVIEEHR